MWKPSQTPLAVIVAALLAPALTARAETETGVTVVTAVEAAAFDVRLLDTPEAWARLETEAAKLQGGLGLCLVYPTPRYPVLTLGEAGTGLDVLLVDETHHVTEVVERPSPKTAVAAVEPVVAVLLLPSSATASRDFAIGNLVVPNGFRLQSVVAKEDRESLKRASFAKALEKMSRAARRGDPQTLLNLARLELAGKDPGAAARTLRRIPEAQRTARALLVAAEISRAQRRQDEALGTLRQALAKASDDPNVLHETVRALVAMGRPREAVDLLSRLSAADATAAALRIELAELYMASSSFGEAERVLADFESHDAKSRARVNRLLGDVHLRRGEMAAAAACYAVFLEVFPIAPHASELRAFVARHRKPSPRAAGPADAKGGKP